MHHWVLGLPANPAPLNIYFVKTSESTVSMYVTNAKGKPFLVSGGGGGITLTSPNGTISITDGTKLDISQSVLNDIISLHNLFPDLQGGSPGQYYHLTEAQYLAVLGLINPQISGLISIGSIVENGNEITLNEVVWKFENQQFEVDSQVFNIPPATEDYFRTDIIVGNNLGELVLIQGEESTDNAVAPSIPENAVLIASINVFGDTIFPPQPSVDGFLKESSEGQRIFPYTVPTIDLLSLSDNNTYRYGGTQEMRINSMSTFNDPENQDALYDGRNLTFINTGTANLIFTHLVSGIGEDMVFFNSEEQDFILEPNHAITYKYYSTLNRFEQISSTLTSIPNAQQVFEQGSEVEIDEPISISSTELNGDKRSFIYLSPEEVQLYNYDENGLQTGFTINQGVLQFTSESEKGIYYSDDYNDTNLTFDRYIPDVGGVKQLIITETDFSNLLKLTGETSQSVEGDVIFEGNAIGNLTPTQNNHLVRKDYVDGLLTSIVRLAGDWDASGGTFPTTGTGTAGAIRRGDSYITTVAGIIAGQEYGVGDSFYAKVNNPGQTPSNWARYEVPAGLGTPTTAGIVKLFTTTGSAVDGTMDQNSITNALNAKATDALVVHKAGNETITGFKTFLSTTPGVSSVYFNNAVLGGTGNEAAIFLTSTYNGISASAFGGTNFITANLTANNSVGVTLDSSSNQIGDYFIAKKNGATRFKVDYLGNVTGNSFIKSGGTSTQFLKADGSVDSNNYATTSVIAQTITNGVTTSAPSQDAVFDALALKANLSGGNNFTGNQIVAGNLISDGGVFGGMTLASDNFISFQTAGTRMNIQGANYADSAPKTLWMQFFGGNVILGNSTTDTGEKLQVSGQVKFDLYDLPNSTPGITIYTKSSPANPYALRVVNKDTDEHLFSVSKNGLTITKSLLSNQYVNSPKAIIRPSGNPETGEALQVEGDGVIEGGLKVANAPTDPTDVVRLQDLQNIILSGSATLDFPSTMPGESSELTITVTGATLGDVVAIGVPDDSTAPGTCFTGRVSSTDTVTIKLNNYSSISVDPVSGIFKCKVFKD